MAATVQADTREMLARAGCALYGDRWQSELARAIGVADRTVRAWVAGERRVAPGVWTDIVQLLRESQSETTALLRDLGAPTNSA